MRFMVDESTGKRLNELMKNSRFDSVFVGDILKGASDQSIIEEAERQKRILITDDKDFGELVFRLNKPTAGVILLRTLSANPEKRMRLLSELIRTYDLKRKFVTLSEDRVRIRKI